MERPVGVAQQLATEEDEISFAFLHDGVGLSGFGDEADGSGGDGGFASGSGGKLDLESGAGGNLCVGNHSARGDIDEIDAVLAQKPGELNGFVNGPAAGNPIRGGDANQERKVSRPLGTNGVDDLQGEACAILKAAAISVSALVGERREELVEQIAVGGVNFYGVVAGLEGPTRSQGEGVDDGLDAGLVESLGQGVAGREG